MSGTMWEDANDPFPLTPPSAAEQARVESDAALLAAAADRLDRLIADGTDLPWRVGDHADGDAGWTIHGPDAKAKWPVAGPYYEGGGVWERADADLIAALVNAGPDLVAWLRDAVQEAEMIGPNRFAMALARKIMGEQR